MPETSPLFSVLVTAYNRLRYLPAALASVRSQSVQDVEVVVVDDGSRDGTWGWLRRRRLPGVLALRQPRNRGVAAARNLGLSRCRGRLVAALDSDDLWRPGFLRAMARCFEEPATMVAFSDYDDIDARGRVLRRAAFRDGRVYQPGYLPVIGHSRAPLFSATVFRRAVFDEIGGFDEGFRQLGDESDLILRAGLRYGPGAFRFVSRRLACYRRHDGRRQTSLSRGGTEVLLDRLYKRHKHRHWLSLLAEGSA